MHNIVISYLHKQCIFQAKQLFEPNGGSKNERGPLISIKFVPRGPKNLDWGS